MHKPMLVLITLALIALFTSQVLAQNCCSSYSSVWDKKAGYGSQCSGWKCTHEGDCRKADCGKKSCDTWHKGCCEEHKVAKCRDRGCSNQEVGACHGRPVGGMQIRKEVRIVVQGPEPREIFQENGMLIDGLERCYCLPQYSIRELRDRNDKALQMTAGNDEEEDDDEDAPPPQSCNRGACSPGREISLREAPAPARLVALGRELKELHFRCRNGSPK